MFESNLILKNNKANKINTSYNILRATIIKYKQVQSFNKSEVYFSEEIRIVIKNNSIYETPGFMPYFTKIDSAYFKYNDGILSLAIIIDKTLYEQVIFYDK